MSYEMTIRLTDREYAILIFICADNGLIETAIAEKLNIENPNNY